MIKPTCRFMNVKQWICWILEQLNILQEEIDNIPEGPPGPQGPKGDKGDPGPPGGTGYFYLGQWDASNTYPLTFNGGIVYVSQCGKMYKNLIANNTGNSPNSNPLKWDKIFG